MKIIISYIIPALLLFSCSGKDAAENTEAAAATKADHSVSLTPEQVRNAGILVSEAEERPVNTTIRVNGVIDVLPGSHVSVSAPLGGYLKKISLVPGTRISRGSVLAVLEDQRYIQLQQDYLTAKSRLYFLEADFKRQKGLNESKATSDKSMQQVQSDYTNQRILLRSLAEQLRLIGIVPEQLNENNISRSVSLHSPISGYVSKVNANAGKYVNPEDVIFELIDPRDIAVNLTVFENDAPRLEPGQQVLFSAANHPGNSYKAAITFISPDIAENRTLQIYARPEKTSRELLPGTYISAEISLNKVSALTLPEEAIVKWENRNYIFVEENQGHFTMMPVETGGSHNGYTEIRTALSSRKIVVKQAYTLLMKMKNNESE